MIPKVTIAEAHKGHARYSHLAFMEYCWQRQRPFKQGIHTIAICSEIDKAFENFRNGISTFLIVLVCFRQGKSEIVSRFLPAHFLGEFPDNEVILTSHNSKLATKFSRFSRSVVRSKKYAELYPEVKISRDKSGVEEWGIEGTQGLAQFYGITSGSAGTGGSLIVVDDYFGNREDAESEVMREKVFESFTDNIFTRRADPCIFLFTVTPWHVDDVVGRIKKKMEEDKTYPQFKIVKFPAKSKEYESGYLFPEMYSSQWYGDMEKVLGPYGTASLMQCDPQLKAGNMIRVDKVKFYDDDSELPDGLIWSRGWDLASTVKQTQKQDPDYTVGIKTGIQWIKSSIPGHDIPIIYIDDCVFGQWEATQRKKIIISTTIADGYIKCGVEAFAAYKDAYVEVRDTLIGIRQVIKMQLPGDKIAKASVLVPAFEAGNVYMRRAPWNDFLLKHIREFPGGAHDDGVDAIVVSYELNKSSGIMIYTGSEYQQSLDKREELLRIIDARLPAREAIGCNLDEYMDFVREYLEEKWAETDKEDYKRYILSEIGRLDRALDYDHYKDVV